MMPQLLFDSVDPGNDVRITADGYLVGSARVARTGIQEYLAAELGLTDRDPTDIVSIYRPEEEVFDKAAMSSYAYRPVTIDHPKDFVDADSWKAKASGMTGADVMRDGEFVRVPMTLMDRQAIDEWKSGKKELSMGYTSEIEMKDGIAPDGRHYDGIQRNLRMNHLALVSRARGGSQLKLGDDKPQEGKPMTEKLRTVLVDGLQVETTDAGAQAIEKLTKDAEKAKTALSDAETAHKAALAAKDKEIATKDAEIDDLKGKILDSAALDAAVTARADLLATAKSIADKDYSGKSETEIRKMAVSAKLGDSAIAGKSDEYVQVRFDILAEDAVKDPVRKTIQGGPAPVNDAGTAYNAMVSNLNTAYMGGAK